MLLSSVAAQKEEGKVKQPLVYEVDLTKIQGKGEFHCRNCGVIISPEDETEDVYCILDVKVKDETLEEIVIQCNNCGSRIHLIGFLILDIDNA